MKKKKSSRALLTPVMLRPELEKLSLPTIDSMPGATADVNKADPYYKPILRSLGIHTVQELNMLRHCVADKIEHMQNQKRAEILEKADETDIENIVAGDEEILNSLPLYRDDNDNMRNIPFDIMQWYIFMAWLNEKAVRLS